MTLLSAVRLRRPRLPKHDALAQLRELVELIKEDHEPIELPTLLVPLWLKVFNVDIFAYYARHTDGLVYELKASYPPTFWSDPRVVETFGVWNASKGAMAQCIQSRDIYVVTDPKRAEKEGKYVPFSSRVKSEVTIPIVAREDLLLGGEQVVGVLVMSSFDVAHYSDSDCRILELAGDVVGALHNRVYATVRNRRRIQFLRAVSELDKTNPDTLVRSFLEAFHALLPARFSSVWLFNPIDDSLVIRSFYPPSLDGQEINFTDLDNTILRKTDSLSGKAVCDRVPRVFLDAQGQRGFGNRAFARKFGLRWLICLPITGGPKGVMGVLNVWPSGPPVDLPPDFLSILQQYAAPLSTLLEYTRLQSNQSLVATYDRLLQELLSFRDTREAWDGLACRIRDQMQCEAASIFIYDELSDHITLRGSTGIIGDPAYATCWYEPEEGLTGRTFAEEKPRIYYRELSRQHAGIHKSKCREILKTNDKSKSIVFVPILDVKKNAIGVIRCNNKDESPARHVGRFTHEDIQQLEQLALIASSLYQRVSWMRERDEDREMSVNSLHHELLSPMDGILAHVEWLEETLRDALGGEPWDANRALVKCDDMRQNVELADVLVTTMGRIDERVALNYKPVQLATLVQRCKSFLFNEAKRCKVEIDIKHLGLPIVRADGLQIMRVFYNLIRNGIKYRDSKESNRYLRFESGEDGEDVLILVSDNGIGIPVGEEDSVFRKFKRGSNARQVFPEGTGLGLWYCRAIMEKHGGSIRVVVDKSRKQTVFELRFPGELVQRRLEG